MANDLEIYFVTNRDLIDENNAPWFGDRFNPAGPAGLRFGSAKGRRKAGTEYGVELTGVKVAPENLTAIGDQNRVVGSKVILEALRKRMIGKDGRDTLVLIHGYASTFETSLLRGLELADKYMPAGKPLNIVVFSWPANGDMTPILAYHSDRDDARNSGEALARAMLLLNEFIVTLTPEERCARAIHLVAHSMGNYAFRCGIQHMRRYFGDEPPRLFTEIILAAPDEDDDTFEHDHKMRLLPRLGRRVSVYYAAQDRALLISDITKGNPDRLGSDGPKQISGLPTKVSLVDARMVALDNDIWQAHQYYRKSPRVVYDIVRTLEGLPPDQIKGRVVVPGLRAWRLSKTLPKGA